MTIHLHKLTIRGFRGRGFTLIEMLAALTIAAMLMVGLMGVITSIAQAQAADHEKPPHDRQVADLVVDLLRHDLRHAENLQPPPPEAPESEPNSLKLTGLSGLDQTTATATHRRVQVEYTLEVLHERTWLIRTQRDLDDMTNRNTHRRLVLADVGNFEVMAPGADGSEDETTQPDRVRLRITLRNNDRPLIDRVIYIGGHK